MSLKKVIAPAVIAGIFYACGGPEEKMESKYNYPETKKVDSVDDYFGMKIPDPYRWLEDDNSEETAMWVDAQNKVTNDYLAKIPFREGLKARLTQLWDFEKLTPPHKKGNYYFFKKNDGIQNQAVLYYQEGLNGKPEVLIDPNTFSDDGTISLMNYSISESGKYIAYSLAHAGSDWMNIQVMEIATKKLMRDNVRWVKFSGVSWVEDDGFYYSRYDQPEEGQELSKKNEFHKVYYHFVGDEQIEDFIVYEDKDHAQRNFGAYMTDEGSYLVVSGSESTSGNSLVVKKVTDPNPQFVTIVDNFESDNWVIDNIGDQLLMFTNHNAPKYKLVLVDVKNPSEENWKDLIPQSEDLLESASILGDKIVAVYQHNVANNLVVFDMDGNKVSDVQLPGLGAITGFSSTFKDSVAFFSFSTFTSPSAIYKYDITSSKAEVFIQPKCDFNTDDYETKQVFYASKDGTKIPMFITSKKGVELNGLNPVFLYGYGGFNISVRPSFSADKALFLENGGVYAVANIRGGGEFGEEWHRAGTLCNKQNVFDDFIAAAEYLVKEGYTNHDKIAINGRSNGGLLIGAVMTQRPDIAKVALPVVGVLDMLRYHKFTIGWAWATDYGRSDNKEHFDCLIKYSPLHNLNEVAYPATMVMTGDHDDRVVPAHSFKFAATLQEKHNGDTPVLIHIDKKAGHGSGKPVTKQIEEFADLWSFVFYNLGMEFGKAPKA